MAKSEQGARAEEIVKRLVDLGRGDTVYADTYLRRAREILGRVLTRNQHGALKAIQHDIDDAIKQCKQASVMQDWKRVDELAARAEGLRQRALEGAALRELGAEVYDAFGVPIDPFSPGFDFLPGAEHDPAGLRERVVAHLKAMTGDDPPLASFYRSRQAYFARLAIESKHAEEGPAGTRSIAEVQQLAAQAAQRGDVGQLRRYAQEILELEKQAPAKPEPEAGQRETEGAAAYRCPVDLAAAIPAAAVDRARGLGLVAALTEPLPQAVPLHHYVAARIWSPGFEAARSESEGTMRAASAVDEAGFPADVSEAVKVLVGQFLQNPFVNSGGARYFPRLEAEAVLIEDFAEDGAAHDEGELLRALGLPGRRGLARVEIDDALLEHGATIVEERLGLDPREFRLVCIPHDLYMRCGRDRGWGQRQQWTHFDGYQVLRNGTLRALIGGDVRYGGLTDLLSIGLTDQRPSVVARFAVIRRARQVARWI